MGDVNAPAAKDSIEENNKKLFIKPRKVDFEPRYKMKGKSGTANKFHIKKKVQEEEMRVRNKIFGRTSGPKTGLKCHFQSIPKAHCC